MTTAAFAADDTPIVLPADVASQDWYAPAVRYVMEYDLMDVGHPENGAPVFEPSRTVSRQEVADAIYRAARCLSTKFAAEPSQSGISGMADYAEIGQDYYNAMAFCYENGIMTGSDKKLNPATAISPAGVRSRPSAHDEAVRGERPCRNCPRRRHGGL